MARMGRRNQAAKVADADTVMRPDLAILTCSQCGAAIPFSDSATSVCPFCLTANEVPPAYREMRASRALDSAQRAEAEQVLHKLDRPPLLVTKVLARMFDWNFIAFFLVYGVPLALYDVAVILRFADWIAPRLGKRSGDDVPFWIPVSVGFAAVFVVIFVPRVLGIYANRRATGRMKLLAALSAKPPSTRGGPALCRSCSAPLEVAAGNLLAVCAYCGTQNALQLRTELVAAVTASTKQLTTSIREAEDIDRAERRRTRLTLLYELFRYAWPLAFFAFSLSVSDDPHIGTAMTILAALLLIALPFISAATTKDDALAEAKERRAVNDVPGWVAAIGPVIVWAFFIWGPRFL